MRFTEHELTLAVASAAKSVAGAKTGAKKRRRRVGSEEAWESMTKVERYHLLDAVGGQVLPVLLALPDVEVAAGARPTFTDAQLLHAVEESMAEGGGRMRRKVAVVARAALVKSALAQLPPRLDPDAPGAPE